MIFKSISLIRARKDGAKARAIAGDMAVDAALIPAQAALGKAKLLSWLAFGVIIIFGGLGLWLGAAVHGIFYILLIIAGIAGLILYFALKTLRRAGEAAKAAAGRAALGAEARVKAKMAARRAEAERATQQSCEPRI